MRQFFITVVLLLSAVAAQAGSGTGKITFLLVNYDTVPNYVVFNVENIVNHACASPSTFGKWAVALDIDKGKSILSLLFSAEARGTPIAINGGGSCYFQNRENVNYVFSGAPS